MTRRKLAVLIALALLATAGIAGIVVLIFGSTSFPDQPGTDAGYASPRSVPNPPTSL